MKVAWHSVGLREGLWCACTGRSIVNRASLQQRVPLKPYSRAFTTSSQSQASFAAPEVGFQSERDQGQEKVFYARLVPESPSYFTAQPLFIDDLLNLRKLLQRHERLPTVRPADAPRVAWRTLPEYRDMVGETVKSSKYLKITQILRRLNLIHHSVMPQEVKDTINEYKRDIDPHENVARPIPVDKWGKSLGVGRRKTSVAKAYLVEGTGEVLVNGKTLAEAFGRIHDRESVIWPLKATQRIDKYNVWAMANGGGTTGQAEALTLAVAKALLVHEPALKPALRRGKLTIDLNSVSSAKTSSKRFWYANMLHSRLCHQRPQESREEEARSC